MLFWKSWFNKKIFFIQDILNADVNFLTFREFQNKFSIKTNLHYFQLMVAISSDLKKKARSAEVPSREQLLYSTTVSLFPESTPVDLANMRFKHYYKTLNKNSTVEPTGIKTWKINFAVNIQNGKTNFHLYIIQQEITN